VTAPAPVPARRRVHRLTEAERNAVWECYGPGWYGTFYAWFPEVGWHYATRNWPAWREATAGLGDVTAETITSNWAGTRRGSADSFEFVELARLDPPAVLFTANGDAVPIPETMLPFVSLDPPAEEVPR